MTESDELLDNFNYNPLRGIFITRAGKFGKSDRAILAARRLRQDPLNLVNSSLRNQ